MDSRQLIVVGRRLQEARKHRGLSAEALAQLVESYTPEQIRQFEEGAREMGLEAFMQFCYALKVDMDWLMFGVSAKARYGFDSRFATYSGEEDSKPGGQ
ncbi:MAG TPA: helix-turn-helix transcriptional regulator [Candidatus Faecaligallichristensenella faecipullorum]|nr:helix-turn-helix transcriptional regulator [Candidatus Faecaligallichristensenella faecipullorum]